MITEYIIAVITGMVLDSLWLGIITKSLYQKYIGGLMKKPQLFPAAIFYFIFALAATVFIIAPALKNDWSLWTIIWHSALLGLVIYGAYDLTNLAILKDWPVAISLIDMAWGVVFSTLVCLITVYLSKLLH
jgi:uncharacterized membrane protein